MNEVQACRFGSDEGVKTVMVQSSGSYLQRGSIRVQPWDGCVGGWKNR